MKKKIYTAIGLMSGTSCDGVDASVLKTDGEKILEFGESYYLKYPGEFRKELLALINGDYKNLFIIENQIAEFHAKAVSNLLKKAKLEASSVDVIGFHGQTIIHAPANRITMQLGNAQLLAALTGIDVVYDLRKNDIVHGGQGAPLIPVFHNALASTKGICFVNIGGISNATFISEKGFSGYDCGMGNALINDYCEKHFYVEYDKDGKLAAKGRAEKGIVAQWMSHPFFNKASSKSLDRMEFSNCTRDIKTLNKYDALATLTEFTVQGIINSINKLKPKKVYLCGGGRKNKTLVARLKSLAKMPIELVDKLGVDGDFIESYGWAYLAVRSLRNLPITFPTTTGCKAPLSGGVLAKKTNFITKASYKSASKLKFKN